MDQSINQVLPQVVQDLLTTLSVELSPADISTLRLVDNALSNLLRTAVRTRLNQCAVVNRLPPEVLCAVFDLVRAGSGSGSSYYDDIHVDHRPAIWRPDNRSLIAVTHVCRRWRNVSLGCAQLWTNVSTCCALAPEFFQRSQGMPLTVFVSLVQGRPPPVPKQVFLDQHPRIKVLHIDLECSTQIRHWRKHLQSLAKSLESLTVVNHGHQTHVRANPSVVVPFFGEECPTSLKFLSISSTTVLVPTDRFPALEHAQLSVSPSSFRPFVRFEMPVTRSLLRNAPRLQTFHLHLQSVHSHCLSEESPALERIDLPMMRHLCITLPRIPAYHARSTDGHLGAVRALVSSLGMPPTTVVSIQEASSCSSSDTQAGAMPHLYLPQTTAGLSPESVLSVDSRGTTFIVGCPSTTYFKYSSCISPDRIQSFVNGRPRGVPVPARERAEAALATVRALRIHSCPRWLASAKSFCLHRPAPGEALSRLAMLTPRLTELVLRDYTGEMATHLVRMLAGPVPAHCPGLAAVTYITLGHACDVRAGRFVPGSGEAETETEMETETPGLDVILASTRVRAHLLGRRLQRLVFCCPSIMRDRVLENAHGVERVEVLGTDVWAAHDGVFERGAEARCRVHVQSAKVEKCAARKRSALECTPEEEYEVWWAAERVRARLEIGEEGVAEAASP